MPSFSPLPILPKLSQANSFFLFICTSLHASIIHVHNNNNSNCLLTCASTAAQQRKKLRSSTGERQVSVPARSLMLEMNAPSALGASPCQSGASRGEVAPRVVAQKLRTSSDPRGEDGAGRTWSVVVGSFLARGTRVRCGGLRAAGWMARGERERDLRPSAVSRAQGRGRVWI